MGEGANTRIGGERPATAAQLRHEIDSGATGDKVASSDPATVPLGTDDEAAGRAPSPAERAMAEQSQPIGLLPQRDKPRVLIVYAAMIGGIGILVAMLALWLR